MNEISFAQDDGRPVISGRYALRGFRSDFAHCSATADLFAHLTASAIGSLGGAVDNLSTALNELLEWGFRCAAEEGDLCLQVSEQGSGLRLSLTVPMAAASKVSLLRVVADLDVDSAREFFVSELEKPLAEASPLLGLYWLAGEYGHLYAADSEQPDDRLQLALDLQR